MQFSNLEEKNKIRRSESVRKKINLRKIRTDRTTRLLIVILSLFLVSEFPQVNRDQNNSNISAGNACINIILWRVYTSSLEFWMLTVRAKYLGLVGQNSILIMIDLRTNTERQIKIIRAALIFVPFNIFQNKHQRVKKFIRSSCLGIS